MQIFHDFAIVRLRFWFRKVLIKNIRIINTPYAAMGSPLSPTSANSLVWYHEKAWSDGIQQTSVAQPICERYFCGFQKGISETIFKLH